LIGQKIFDETAKVAAAPLTTVAASYNQATQALEVLLHSCDQTGDVLKWVLRVLALIKTPLLVATPWGPLTVYAAYLGVFSYTI
jgi:hypothetical protein